MLILGISDSHDASVTLIENDEVLAAVSEERFTRRKRQQGFPYQCLGYVKSFIQDRCVEKVYVAGKYGRGIFRILNFIYSRGGPCKNIFSFFSKIAYWSENTIAGIPILRELESKVSIIAIKSHLKKSGIKFLSVELLDHHYSHIISALSGMNSKNYLVISSDAYGDGASGLVIAVENEKIKFLRRVSHINSIAQFYAYISAYLGFKEGDEGKVMALADFGESSNLIGIFKQLFAVDNSGLRVSRKYKSRYFLKQFKNYADKDVAFALQKVTEEIALKFIRTCVKKDDKPDLFLAGGFFANIKVNQHLHETGSFNRIFIFPNMGDGGTSFVSIMHNSVAGSLNEGTANIDKLKFIELKNIYLGPAYRDKDIKNILDENSLDYSQEDDIETRVAHLLAEGRTVARFNGRLEYGPRALGNRSILYQTMDKTVIKWLNERLRRDEFMPFAPVTLYAFKDMCYVNVNGAEYAAKFMTISFNCTEWMRNISPAVVHVDGTARPQLIKEEDNPSYYKILKEYHKLTGIPSLINTSFNMHGEPIVCSPQEAVRTFKLAKIDYLAIGKFLVKPLFS